MSLKFDSISCSKEAAAYSGFIIAGNVEVFAEEGASVNSKGVLVEIVGHEVVTDKQNGGKTHTKEVFPERTPRCILTFKENTYYQNIEIPLDTYTILCFEVLIPVETGSSFLASYDRFDVSLRYSIKASATINKELVTVEQPVYLVYYPFGHVDWFTTTEKEMEKMVRLNTSKTVRKTRCCFSSEEKIDIVKNIRLILTFPPVLEYGKILKGSLRFLNCEPNDAIFSFCFAEVVSVKGIDSSGPVTTIKKIKDFAVYSSSEEKVDFEVELKDLERYDFYYEGVLFTRQFCLVVNDHDRFEFIAPVKIISHVNFKIAQNIKNKNLEERNAHSLLVPVSYENEKMY